MESFTQVNTGFVIGETGGLRPLSSIFTAEEKAIYVPEFLWQFGYKKYVTSRDIFREWDERYNSKCHFHQDLSFDLPDTCISIGCDGDSFNEALLDEDDLYSYVCIEVSQGGRHLALEVSTHGVYLDNLANGSDVQTVYYTVLMGGRMRSYFSRFVPLHPGEKAFNRIRGLGARNTLSAQGFIASLGLANNKYTLLFRGKKLSRQSYIFLLGTYGILLDDEFKFDSLVLLRSANHGVVDIDHIVYSVSTYMTKIMVLRPGD